MAEIPDWQERSTGFLLNLEKLDPERELLQNVLLHREPNQQFEDLQHVVHIDGAAPCL